MAAKKHNPISNLAHWAHPKKTNVNFTPKKSQQVALEPKMMGATGDRGKKPTHPGFTKSGKKVMK